MLTKHNFSFLCLYCSLFRGFFLPSVKNIETGINSKQLYQELPTPNVYRTASGAPGMNTGSKKQITGSPSNWTTKQRIYGEETVLTTIILLTP